jgi:hypothetical protein
MFSSEKFGRIALAMVGTILFTTVSVGAAVGPAEIDTSRSYAMGEQSRIAVTERA